MVSLCVGHVTAAKLLPWSTMSGGRATGTLVPRVLLLELLLSHRVVVVAPGRYLLAGSR